MERGWKSGKHIVAIDLSNAFNSAHREAVIAAIPDGVPGARCARALYGDGSWQRLPGAGWGVRCTEGVVQRCPLAAALFANAIAEQVKEGRGQSEVEEVWYADDGHLWGSSWAELETRVRFLKMNLEKVGLRLQERRKSCRRRAVMPYLSRCGKWRERTQRRGC